ncbi:hypothetical protein RN001_005108 [Aquatica leii]|uniref:Protein AAR2 homolog n=1 Tax=Aquatica leii TaxID=1421715 RepID=A0AAN7SIN4_9COLE|nr:hypothetical protein RN001_005108 [Aquatica leii]
MDNSQNQLIEGGTLVLLNVPPGTELGIDMKIWTIGENFRGIKMIPPGIHFIHYSALNDYGDVTPKTGFFYNFRRSEFVVKKWDRVLQDISLDEVPESEVVQLKDSITILDKFLGPYPYSIWKKWTLLTSHVTDNLIKRLMPETGRVKSVLDLMCQAKSEEGPSSKCLRKPRWGNSLTEAIEEDLLPNLKPVPGTDIRLTPLPNRNYPEGSIPSEITRHSLDSTYSLELMINSFQEKTDLIGELQFAYVCFLVGHSIEAFEHWKNLVCLLCSCEVAIKKYYTVYDIFVTTLEGQILETPPEFLADIVTNNNIIYLKLRTFFLSVSDSDVHGRFKTKVERFKHNLTSKFEWDFTHLDSDDEEDAPVVVDLG